MKRISVSEAKDTLSACLARVREGESLVITDRGRPVAILSPIAHDETSESERLASLARRGIVRAPKISPQTPRRLPRLVKINSLTAALDALAEDREDYR